MERRRHVTWSRKSIAFVILFAGEVIALMETSDLAWRLRWLDEIVLDLCALSTLPAFRKEGGVLYDVPALCRAEQGCSYFHLAFK